MGEMIRELNRRGTTFLLVEHNMPFVLGLCDPCTCWRAARASAPARRTAIQRDPLVLDAYLGDDYLLEREAVGG